MRIWLVNHYYNSPLLPGGTRHHTLAKKLTHLGHEVIIFAADFNHFTKQYVATSIDKSKKLDKVDDVTIAWLATPAYRDNSVMRLWNSLCFAWQLRKVKRALPDVQPPDLIIGSSPHLFAAYSAARLARQFNVPFVLEVRDIWPDSLSELGKLSPYHPIIWLFKKTERWLYRHAKSIITLLPNSMSYIKSKIRDHNKEILWLPNFIDLQRAASPPVLSSELPEKKEKISIMYAGTHGFANGLEVIIKAAKILQERGFAEKIEFNLVGEGPEKNNLINLTQQLNLKIIRFHAPVAKDKIYPLLATADAFLMILKDSPVFRWGVSPNKLFDYMLMAKPIVFAVNSSGNPIEASGAGYSILPENADLLADVIEKIYHLSSLERHQMGLRGYQYVAANHDVNLLVLKLEQLLLKTMTKH